MGIYTDTKINGTEYIKAPLEADQLDVLIEAVDTFVAANKGSKRIDDKNTARETQRLLQRARQNFDR
jgi:hypothetical protein